MRKLLSILPCWLALLLLSVAAAAQGGGQGGGGGPGGVTVQGAVTPGHCTSFVSANVIQDAGGICGGAGASPGGSVGQLQFNNTTFGGIAQWSSNGTTTITGGATGILDLSALTTTNIKFPTQTANFFYAAPNGAGGAPGFRAIVAADIPTLNQSTTGTSSNITGVAAPVNGGTGLNTSAATGVAQVNAGTWSVSTALAGTTTAANQPLGTNNQTVANTAFVLANAAGNIAGLQGGTAGYIASFVNSTNGAAGPSPLQTFPVAGADRCAVWLAQLNFAVAGVSGDPVSALGDIVYASLGQIECDTNPLPNGHDPIGGSPAFGGGQLILPSGNIAAKNPIKFEASNMSVIGTGRGGTSGANPTNIQAIGSFPSGAGILGGASIVCNNIAVSTGIGGGCTVSINNARNFNGCLVGGGSSCTNADGGITFTKGSNSNFANPVLVWTGGGCTTWPVIDLRVGAGGTIIGFDVGAIGTTNGNAYGTFCSTPPTAVIVNGFNGTAGANFGLGGTGPVSGPIGSAALVQIGSTDNIFLEAQKAMWFSMDGGAVGTPTTPGPSDYLTCFQDFSSQEEGYFDGLKSNNCGVAAFDIGGHSDQHQNGSELNNIESIWPNGTNCPNPTTTWMGTPWPAITAISNTGAGVVTVTLASNVPLIVQTQEVVITNVPPGLAHGINYNSGRGSAAGDGNVSIMITSPTCSNCNQFTYQLNALTADTSAGGTVTPWPTGVRIGGHSNIGGVNHDTIGAPGCINPTAAAPAGSPAIWTKAGATTNTGASTGPSTAATGNVPVTNTATLTLGAGNFPAQFTVGQNVTVTTCSVGGYNITAPITSGGSGTAALTYTVGSALGAATGCTATMPSIATFTATSGAMPAAYTVGATGFMTGCSVLAYNVPLTILSSAGTPGVVTYNLLDPLGNPNSGLGAGSGCVIKIDTVPLISHDLSGNNFHTRLTHTEQWRTGYQFGTLPIPTQGYFGQGMQCSNDTFNSTGGDSCVHIVKIGNLSQPNFISSWIINANSPGPVALGPNNLLRDDFNGVILPSASVGDFSAYYDVNGYPEMIWDVDNSLTSFTGAEAGNVVTLTTTNAAAKLTGNYAAGSTIFVYGCSVAGYNVAAIIQSVNAAAPGVITYNAPTGSMAGATGCIATSNVLSGFTMGSQPGLAATAPIPSWAIFDNNHQEQWAVNNSGFETNSISQSTIGTQAVLGADYTNATTGPTAVFTWSLPKLLPVGAPAKTYHFACDMIWESTAASLTNLILGVNLSSATGLGQLTAGGFIVTNVSGAMTTNYVSNTTSGNQTVITGGTANAANTPYPVRFFGTIETAPIAATTFTITATETAAVSQTVTIKRGATCQLN